MLIPDVSCVVGAWGLIDNDPVTGDSRQEDLDAVFILTPESYYMAQYDNAVDKVTQYQKVLLSNVDRIEFGTVESGAFNIAFGRNQTRNEHSMRIWYRMPCEGASCRCLD